MCCFEHICNDGTCLCVSFNLEGSDIMEMVQITKWLLNTHRQYCTNDNSSHIYFLTFIWF